MREREIKAKGVFVGEKENETCEPVKWGNKRRESVAVPMINAIDAEMGACIRSQSHRRTLPLL